MPNAPKRITPYAAYVNSNLPFRMAEGQGLYNYKELAVLVGLKPTHNFRRRVNFLASTGIISVEACFTPTGGIENRFSTTKERLAEIPF